MPVVGHFLVIRLLYRLYRPVGQSDSQAVLDNGQLWVAITFRFKN